MYLGRFWYSACFIAIAVQGQTSKLSSGNVYGVPFKYYGSLGSVATAEEGCRGSSLAKGMVNVGLKGVESGSGVGFLIVVPGNSDIYYAARGDVRWEEN